MSSKVKIGLMFSLGTFVGALFYSLLLAPPPQNTNNCVADLLAMAVKFADIQDKLNDTKDQLSVCDSSLNLCDSSLEHCEKHK
jgi:hypothetical protein